MNSRPIDTLSDAERQLPDVLDELEREFETLGIDDSELTIRMTGCPNGCARPYNADIGFVGRKPGVYHIFVGGGLGGDRLADLFAADVPVERMLETLRPLLRRFAGERNGGEGLGPFYRRITGRTERRTLLKVSMEDAVLADQTFQTLMGDDVEPRRNFIEQNARFVSNLDI